MFSSYFILSKLFINKVTHSYVKFYWQLQVRINISMSKVVQIPNKQQHENLENSLTLPSWRHTWSVKIRFTKFILLHTRNVKCLLKHGSSWSLFSDINLQFSISIILKKYKDYLIFTDLTEFTLKRMLSFHYC